MVQSSARLPNARAWLPPSALYALDIEGVLAEITRAWSATWFAHATVRPLEALCAIPTSIVRDEGWLALDSDLAICVTQDGTSGLPSLIFDLELPTERTVADEHVLSEVVQTCLDDLCKRLAEAFRLDAAKRWHPAPRDTPAPIDGPYGCTFGVESHSPLLRILVANDALIALAKAGPGPLAKGRALSPLSTALGAQDVAVSAHVGRCSLAIADVTKLGIGDVLIFDRAIDTPLDMLVNGSGAPVARCHIVQADGRLDLTLLESIGEQT